jgi:hypothetical protein
VTDSVADLKALVAAQAGAPAADAQRLLLKGKALADSKLLKEYGLADGAVINLMVKPGAAASAVPATPPAATLASPVPVHAGAGGLSVSASSSAPRSPTLTITTPVEGALPTEVPGGLNFDDAPVSPVATKAFHDTAANPAFWSKLHTLLHSEFAHGSDADTVFDSFLVSMRGRLTASESAKIRDVVGVAGEYESHEAQWCHHQALLGTRGDCLAQFIVTDVDKVWAAVHKRDSQQFRANDKVYSTFLCMRVYRATNTVMVDGWSVGGGDVGDTQLWDIYKTRYSTRPEG